MVVTMLEAAVAREREADLARAYHEVVVDGLPDIIVETFLLRLLASDTWRIVTIWRSRADLEAMRASGETPAGVRVFRAAGAEPALAVFEVVDFATR